MQMALQYGIRWVIQDLLKNVEFTKQELEGFLWQCTSTRRLENIAMELIMWGVQPTAFAVVAFIIHGTSDMVNTCLELRPELIQNPSVIGAAIAYRRSYTLKQLLKKGAIPNVVDYSTLKTDHSTPIVIDVSTLDLLLKTGLNPNNPHLHKHIIHHAPCVDLLENQYGVDLTKTRMYDIRRLEDMQKFLSTHPGAETYVDGDFLLNAFSIVANTDMILYIFTFVSDEELKQRFPEFLRYAHSPKVFDELFLRSGMPVPMYAVHTRNRQRTVQKEFSAKWLKSLAVHMARVDDQLGYSEAKTAVAAFEYLMQVFPIHVVEHILFQNFTSKRAKHHYDNMMKRFKLECVSI